VPNDRKPRGPRLSDEGRDEYPRKTPPAGVQAALEAGAEISAVCVELGVPLHEIEFEHTDLNNLEQVVAKTYARTKALSGAYRVLDKKIDDKTGAISDQVKELKGVNDRQLDILGDIAKRRADTYNEISKFNATSRAKNVAVILGGIFGTGGILAILAVAITKGC